MTMMLVEVGGQMKNVRIGKTVPEMKMLFYGTNQEYMTPLG